MITRINRSVESLLRNKIVSALDDIWSDEKFTDQFDARIGSDTIAYAAEAALSVIMAQSQIQEEGIASGWWDEKD